MGPYAILTVTGGNAAEGRTEYDEPNRQAADTFRGATQLALTMPGTKDIFNNQIVVARVHVDGGIDHYVPTGQLD